MKDVIALLNCHECARLGVLTEERPLASTSFLGRYAFMDVALSNFTNSGIDNVGILVKDHQRSILKHMGNMSSWVNNTKTDKITLLTNEKGLINPPYNTDLANLKENDYLLYDSSASTLVFQSPHIIAPIDFNPIVKEHRERGEGITIVYKRIKDGDRDFVGQCRLTIERDLCKSCHLDHRPQSFARNRQREPKTRPFFRNRRFHRLFRQEQTP